MEIKKTYWLFLAAIAAATLFFYSSCGGGGDTTPESDTFVSEDATLGDNSVPDNTPPDTATPDTEKETSTETEEAEEEIQSFPCEGGDWLNGDFKCCNPSGTSCHGSTCKVEKIDCQLHCTSVINYASLNPPPDWLVLEPPSKFTSVAITGDIICTKQQ